jgi:hypothetical protein
LENVSRQDCVAESTYLGRESVEIDNEPRLYFLNTQLQEINSFLLGHVLPIISVQRGEDEEGAVTVSSELFLVARSRGYRLLHFVIVFLFSWLLY